MGKELRVWWITNGNEPVYFYTKSEKEAMIILTTLAIKELNDENVVFNASGVEILEDGEWNEYYSEDGDSFDEEYEHELENLFTNMVEGE